MAHYPSVPQKGISAEIRPGSQMLAAVAV